MITIMGASGHTGHVAAERLLKEGRKVRAIARSQDRLKHLIALGAEPAVGDAADAGFLAGAFRGSDVVYTLIPGDPTHEDYPALQDRIGEAITSAIKTSGVKKVVFLSSIGGEQLTGTGPITGLARQERRLAAISGLNSLCLRPTYFMENHLATLGLIKHQGINGSALAGDVPMPMIASGDIGQFAAQALAKPDFTGTSTRELLGPRDLTMNEVTGIIGAAIGKPDLAYMQFPYDAALEGLMGAGLSRSMASLYVEMSRAFNEGRIKSIEGRGPRNTTPTRFEDFAAHVIAPLYRAV
jgi:uncharacterized protein YbjT (DUF2867 family)